MEVKHKDSLLNLLRWTAFGAMGVYLWQVKRKEGTLKGANPEAKNIAFDINTDKLADCITPLIPIEDSQKPIINAGLKEFFSGFKKRYL